jgi:hypothetical protein
VLSTFTFKEHVGKAIDEDEVGQILNLLLEAAILAIEAFAATHQPITDKLRKSLGYQVFIHILDHRKQWYRSG